MAFVELESWDARREFRAGGAGDPVRSRLIPHLSKKADRSLRYGAAGIISACVHVLLLWVLASRLAPETVAQASRPLTLLDLSAAPAPPEQPPQAPAPRPAPRPAEVDRTVANAVPPLEWTLAALPASAQEQPQPVAPGGASGAGASSGAGEAPYDPYAGAAPLRRAAAEVGGGAGFELDKVALDTIRSAVSRSLKGGHGTAEIAVRIGGDGRVLEAMWLGGSASPAAQAAIRQALLGVRLYRPGPGIPGDGRWIIQLPILQLRA